MKQLLCRSHGKTRSDLDRRERESEQPLLNEELLSGCIAVFRKVPAFAFAAALALCSLVSACAWLEAKRKAASPDGKTA